MGNKKNKLNWQWPLISLEWLPGIVGSLDCLLEPSWAGLQREMIANVANQSFGKRIFLQLQNLLLETELIRENGRFLQASTKPTRQEVRRHLKKLFENSSEPWAIYYQKISSKKLPLSFANQRDTGVAEWKDSYNYPIFKQWAEFFQFIGLAFFIEGETFIPESALTFKMLEDKLFVEKCIKTNRDPRLLSGHYSLHTEVDFFAWTKGEENLPISRDSKLSNRIPHESITKRSNTSYVTKIGEGVASWNKQIEQNTQDIITFNLESLIITHKIFIDYFLFGSRVYDLDFLSQEKLLTIKNKWSTVPNFHMSENIWKAMPKIYNNITRLNFGVLYYRNSLQRVLNPWEIYSEELISMPSSDSIKKLPIRSFRTKRHLGNFLENISLISTSITRLIETNTVEKYRRDASSIYSEAVAFLPKDVIEKKSILEETSKIIVLTNEELLNLKQELPTNFLSDCPQHPKLATCYWVHRKHKISRHPKALTVRSIKKKLSNAEKKFKLDMTYFEQDMERWDEACANLKKTIMTFTPTQ